MGLAASQARLLLLTARNSDLVFKGQMINQARMKLAYTSGQLLNTPGAYDPSSANAKRIQAKLEHLQQVDKMLEMQLRTVDTQQQAVQTEISAVQKVIDKNIDMSFKTFS